MARGLAVARGLGTTGTTDFAQGLEGDRLALCDLREGALDGPRVAGGPDCDPDADPAEIAAGANPCLGIDPEGGLDALRFYIDESVHGQVLQPGTKYFVVLPGLADIGQMADPESYAVAFHDACGMPLIVGSTPEELALWELSFTVDAVCP